MKCAECDSDVEVTVDRDVVVKQRYTDLEDDTISARGEYVKTVYAACDCTTIEINRKGRTIPSIPGEWATGGREA